MTRTRRIGLLAALTLLACMATLAQEQTKKFAIHFRTMVGTAGQELRFVQNGTLDEWATGEHYYDTKDLSQITSITRYFPVRDFTFSQPDLVMKPGERCQIDIAFEPANAVIQYVDKRIYSNNNNVALARRLRGNRIEVEAVAAGNCVLTLTHAEAGERQLHIEVLPDEAYVERPVDSLLALMTDDEKFSLLGGTNWYYTKGVDRLDIPRMRMCDGPNGVGKDVGNGPATAFPPDVALAATWNRELAVRYGVALGQECRAHGLNFVLGPAVNIYRAPMCGRNFEYMGEDPYLAGQTAAHYIKGLQSQGVSAVVKHFIANNSDYDRDHISNDMDERTMHEIYLPAFKAAVQEGGTGALMTSYNLVNGIYTTHSRYLLTDVLRDKWGFRGIVMSDWGSTHDGVAAAYGGLDLEMASADHMTPATLRQAIVDGRLSMEDIDLKVRHILHTMIAFGFHDGMQQDTSIPIENHASDSVALQVAREEMVLLKNANGILPLDPTQVKRIAVVGKNATGFIAGGGSSSVTPWHYVSMYDGIRTVGERYGIEVENKDKLDLLAPLMYTGDDLSTPGLRADYYNNTELSGSPVASRVEQKINHIWSATGPEVGGLGKENYSVRWSGVMCADRTGNYQFDIGADDGYRLIIDGTTVLDGWKAGAFHTGTYTKRLTAGQKYSIVIEFYQKGGDSRVTFSWRRSTDTTDHLAQYLRDFDVVVACIGFNSSCEAEGYDRSFTLPTEDQELLASVNKSGTPVVVFANAGGNIEMQSWLPKVNALVWAFYGGQQAGMAAAELLFGLANPSGHLPMTFEKKWADNPTYNSYHDPDGDKHVKYTEGIFVGYRGYDKLKREPQFPFGFGLSYTTFSLTDMECQPQKDGSLTVSCTLTNTGDRDGAQVVQTYVGAQDSPVERPLRELKNYAKVFVKAGQSERVTIVLPCSAFTYYDADVAHDFVYAPGRYSVMLGFSSRDIQCQETIQMK